MTNSFLRYISENTKNEAENKIKNIRKVSFDISEHVKDYSLETPINYLNMNKERLIAKQNFLDKFENKKLPVHMPKKRFHKLVNKLFDTFENDNKELNDLIIDSFIGDIHDLNDFINNNRCITFVSSRLKVEKFKELGAHKTDAILLDEAYHLHLMLKEPVNFITFDSAL